MNMKLKIGEFCKRKREEEGLTVSEFSKILNISTQSVYNMEEGRNFSLKIFEYMFKYIEEVFS